MIRVSLSRKKKENDEENEKKQQRTALRQGALNQRSLADVLIKRTCEINCTGCSVYAIRDRSSKLSTVDATAQKACLVFLLCLFNWPFVHFHNIYFISHDDNNNDTDGDQTGSGWHRAINSLISQDDALRDWFSSSRLSRRSASSIAAMNDVSTLESIAKPLLQPFANCLLVAPFHIRTIISLFPVAFTSWRCNVCLKSRVNGELAYDPAQLPQNVLTKAIWIITEL